MTVIRDPIWQNIWIEPPALNLIDTAAFQRLRRVKQLGLAYLVYPGAIHTRFDHALGVYHLTGRALRRLEASGELDTVSEHDRSILRLACSMTSATIRSATRWRSWRPGWCLTTTRSWPGSSWRIRRWPPRWRLWGPTPRERSTR